MIESENTVPGPGTVSLPSVSPWDGTGPGSVRTLRKRSDFLACARGLRAVSKGFVLQGRRRRDGGGEIGIGFTASKKVGNAVTRNRAKRRLRALARDVLPSRGHAGWDYVLIARKDGATDLPFDDLRADLDHALIRLHRTDKEPAQTS